MTSNFRHSGLGHRDGNFNLSPCGRGSTAGVAAAFAAAGTRSCREWPSGAGDSKLEMFAIDGLSMCTPSQLAPGPGRGPPGRHGGTAAATATRDRDGPSSPVSEPTAAESDSESSAALSAVSGGSPVSLGPVLETELPAGARVPRPAATRTAAAKAELCLEYRRQRNSL